MHRRLWTKLWWCEDDHIQEGWSLTLAGIWEIHVRKDQNWMQKPKCPNRPGYLSKYEQKRSTELGERSFQSWHTKSFFLENCFLIIFPLLSGILRPGSIKIERSLKKYRRGLILRFFGRIRNPNSLQTPPEPPPRGPVAHTHTHTPASLARFSTVLRFA